MSVLEAVGRIVFAAYMVAVLPGLLGVLAGRVHPAGWRGARDLTIGVVTYRLVRDELAELRTLPYTVAARRCTCCPVHGPHTCV